MNHTLNTQATPLTNAAVAASLARIRGAQTTAPDASIVIPVNAKGDLDNVRFILSDLAKYQGEHTCEVVLLINNYDEAAPPSEINEFAELGIHVVAQPNIRCAGECVAFTARVAGTRAASSDIAMLFDADCRIPDATKLIDWYVERFQSGYDVAYTHVGYYQLRENLPNRVRMCVHYASRWVKRVLLRIPTLRGSNYAIGRSTLLSLYDEGWLADDMNVGPTCRATGRKIAYSSSEQRIVLTSGRMFSGESWIGLGRYFLRRLRFNLRVLRVRSDASKHTQRELDPERRYVNNRPVS